MYNLLHGFHDFWFNIEFNTGFSFGFNIRFNIGLITWFNICPNVVIVLWFAKEAFAELNDTAGVSFIEETLGAPREGNKT